MAIVLVILALAPPREGLTVATWLAAGAGPLVLLAITHALPLGWHHPWISADLTTLTTHASAPAANQWSIDPGRSIDSATWIAGFAALVWCLLALFPARRLPLLADSVVLALAGYAAWALALSLVSGAHGPRSWAVGGFTYHNHAGAAWAACLPLALVQALARGGWRWVVPTVLTVALVHSASRGAIILGLLVSGPLLLGLLPKQRRWLVAAGVAAGLATLFTLIGTGAASGRFRDMGEGQTVTTLNGRVVIWRAAEPVIVDAQPFGSGAGTAGLAMQRAVGIDATGDIDHLHSEPLELLLEFGWAGALIIATGLVLAVILLRREREPPTGDGGLRLALGAGLGLFILGLHSLTDYILHNPAIDLIVVALLAIWVQSWAQPIRYAPALWSRGAMVCVGLVLMATALLSTLRENEFRQIPRLPVDANARVTALTPEFAAATAEALFNYPERAKAWLAQAARLAPGSAAAWRIRALLETRLERTDAALDACSRLLTWAPDWDPGQDAVLFCLERLPVNIARGERPVTLARTLLTSDRILPTATWDILARVLGDADLARNIKELKPERVRAAALPWLRQHADLATWQAVRRSVAPIYPLDPIQWRIVSDDHDPRAFALAIAPDRNGRHEQAERCLRSGLGLPPPLDTAHVADGDSGSIHHQLALALKGETPATLRHDLDRVLHLSWVGPWWKLLHEREEAALGRWSTLNERSDPSLLAQAADTASHRGDSAIAIRLNGLLSPLCQPSWVDAGWGVRWSWLMSDAATAQTITCPGWTGVFVDDRWLGWERGVLDIAKLTGPGLHRIVLTDPP